MHLLAVGHVARDEFPGQPWRIGGSALYGAATAARLGARVTLVTRLGPDERAAVEQRCADLGISLRALPSDVTTTFAFSADAGGRRVLTLRGRASEITAADVAGAPDADAVLLATIADELAPGLVDAVQAPVIVVAAQGLLREPAADGTIRPRRWERAGRVLRRASAVVVSEEDIGEHAGDPSVWSRTCPVFVTLAERGVCLYAHGETREIAAFDADVVDPTGAGDAFAAGCAVALAEGADVMRAGRFANAVASFAVEGVGTSTLGDRAAVDARLGGARPGGSGAG